MGSQKPESQLKSQRSLKKNDESTVEPIITSDTSLDEIVKAIDAASQEAVSIGNVCSRFQGTVDPIAMRHADAWIQGVSAVVSVLRGESSAGSLTTDFLSRCGLLSTWEQLDMLGVRVDVEQNKRWQEKTKPALIPGAKVLVRPIVPPSTEKGT